MVVVVVTLGVVVVVTFLVVVVVALGVVVVVVTFLVVVVVTLGVVVVVVTFLVVVVVTLGVVVVVVTFLVVVVVTVVVVSVLRYSLGSSLAMWQRMYFKSITEMRPSPSMSCGGSIRKSLSSTRKRAKATTSETSTAPSRSTSMGSNSEPAACAGIAMQSNAISGSATIRSRSKKVRSFIFIVIPPSGHVMKPY